MKRTVSTVVAILIASMSLQGCYGKMALTRKVYHVNGEVKEKHLRSLVTWAFVLVPVYGVSALADFIVFNTIEFWSGHNPVAQGEKNFQYSENGATYRINARKSGEEITYVIDRYNGSRYFDTLSINWDTRSGNSNATFVQSGRKTEFWAKEVDGSVQVTSSAQLPAKADRKRLALN